MPRSSFARGAIQGAASGGSKLFQAILNADKAYQDGFSREEVAQSRIAQAAGATAKNEAQAANLGAKTDVLKRRPDLYEEQAAIGSGYDIPTVQAFRQKLAGGAPTVPMGPPTETGDLGVGSFQVSPEMQTNIGRALQQFLPLVANSGDLNPAQLADAADTYGQVNLRNDVLGGQRTPQSVSDAVAAAAGKLQPSGGTAKAPAGFQWAPEQPGRLQPIPGGPKDPKVNPPKGGAKEVDRDQVAILSQELFNTRESMKSAQGADLARLQGDEAAIISELKTAGVKDVGQLKVQKPAGPAKPPTEGQSKALLFGSRMAVADEILNEMEKSGNFLPNETKQAAESLPGIGGAAGWLLNQSSSVSQQKVEQAQRDFINAVLRRESGAAIADSEFANARKQYFPQRGEPTEVRRQKAIARRTAIEGFKAEIGDGLMPNFLSTVRGARAERQKAAKGENRPGAQTGVYTAPAAPVNRNVRVDF